MPPSWLLWIMVVWYVGKFAFFLFAVAAKLWEAFERTYGKGSREVGGSNG